MLNEEGGSFSGAVHAPNVVLYCLPGYLDHVPSLVRELSKRVQLRVVFEVSRTAWDSNLLGLPRPPFPPGLWPCRDFLREHLPPAIYNDLAGAQELLVAIYGTRAGSDVLVTTRAVRRWLKHTSPDVIHFDGESVRPLLWLRSVRVPSVVSVHEPHVPSRSSYAHIRIAKRALVRHSKRVVVHSNAAECALLRTFGIPRDRIAVVPLGVTEVFAQWPVADPDTTERGGGAHVLFFGRLTPRKGLSVFMAAAESVARQRSHLEFAVFGRPERGLVPAPPPRLANDCTLEVNYARLAPADVASVMRGADIVVAPYLESMQSGVVLTAYAFGKPVVASRVGGLAEQVIDGVTGILVPPGDVSALAAAMLELLDSPDKRREMAESIALVAANELSWERHCERLVSVYAEALQPAS